MARETEAYAQGSQAETWLASNPGHSQMAAEKS
jgi:hypothetical protein